MTHIITSAKPCRLLSLPSELRNLIYSYALVEDEPVEISDYRELAREPSLLRTCPQIRFEASNFYYGGNTFQMYCVSDVKKLLRHCTLENLQMFRSIRAISPSAAITVRDVEFAKQWPDKAMDDMQRVNRRWARSLLRRDAIVTPLLVEGEVIWAPVDQWADFEVGVKDGRKCLIRKAKVEAAR